LEVLGWLLLALDSGLQRQRCLFFEVGCRKTDKSNACDRQIQTSLIYATILREDSNGRMGEQF